MNLIITSPFCAIFRPVHHSYAQNSLIKNQ